MTAVAFYRRPPKLRFIGQAQNNNGAASPAFTTYQKGDLIIGIAAANSGTTVPTVPAGVGWTSVATDAGNSVPCVWTWREAQSNGADGNLGTWTTANGKQYLAFRNWRRGLPYGGASLATAASAANINHPSLTQSQPKRNRIVAWAATRANNAGTRTDATSIYQSTSGLRMRTMLSTEDPVVSAWGSQSVANDTGNTSGHAVAAIEVLGKRRL